MASTGDGKNEDDGGGTLIPPDAYVVLVSSDGNWCLGQAGNQYSARIGRKGRKVALGGLVRAPWGSNFALDGRGLVRMTEDEKGREQTVVEEEDGIKGMEDEEEDGENDKRAMDPAESDRAAEDSAENPKENGDLAKPAGPGQLMSQEEIEELKRSGKPAEELVEMLVKGNTKFDKKSKFAKEKYRRRKERQYRYRILAKRPTARTVCQVYNQKSPDKVMNMRYDSLGLMMNTADVRPCSQVMVIDHCNGMLLSSIAERMGGFGRVLNFFEGRCPAGIDCTRWFNFPESTLRSMVHVPQRFLERLGQVADDDEEPLTYFNTQSGEREEMEGFVPDEQLSAEGLAGRKRRRLEMRTKRPTNGQLRKWIEEGSDALLIASRDSALEHMSRLFPLLRPSSSFAIFNPFIQPLADVQYALSQTNSATRVQLLEISMLHHQILPGRTHPVMKDDIGSTAGYVLSGIRIDSGIQDNAPRCD